MEHYWSTFTEWTMRTRRRWARAALLVSVAACGGKSAADRIAEHDRVCVSWEQTARFVGLEWIDRVLPDAYAARTLERATEELRSESEALEKDRIPEPARVRLRESLGATRALADTLERAVRASDRNAAARLLALFPRANTDSLLGQAGLR
jgi:hypothetical protein